MLEIRGLTKLFNGFPAVDNVSFVARAGEVTGYLGPNGSGKSTTVKIITGLLEPTAGDIYWHGRKTSHDIESFKARLGYVPEEPYLYLHLTGLEYLEMVALLREIPRPRALPKINALLELLGLAGDRYTPISGYSKGMRQKILLIAALLHDPELLILDEPFSGLDVNSALVIRELIVSLAAAGKTVLLSSHEMEIVEKVASHVVILYMGKVVANDSVSNLRALTNLPSLEAIFTELAVEQDTSAIAGNMLEVIRS
jgi:ABC-2 type transport system ATP-binding protein